MAGTSAFPLATLWLHAWSQSTHAFAVLLTGRDIAAPTLILPPEAMQQIEHQLLHNQLPPIDAIEPALRALAQHHAQHAPTNQTDIGDVLFSTLRGISLGHLKPITPQAHPAIHAEIDQMLGRAGWLLGETISPPLLLHTDSQPYADVHLRFIAIPTKQTPEAAYARAHEVAHYLRFQLPALGARFSTLCERKQEEQQADALAMQIIAPEHRAPKPLAAIIRDVNAGRPDYYLSPAQLQQVARIVQQNRYPSLRYDESCNLTNIGSHPTPEAAIRANTQPTR